MKRTLRSTMGLCAALAVSANLALAQTESKTTTDKPPEGKLVKGSEVVGAKLFNQKGEHIGEINDIVFDENTGGMTHGILALGGWLGVGENVTAVPWKFIQQSKKDTPGYVVDVEKSKLTREMSFKVNSWPNLTDGWFKETYAQFGLPHKAGVKLVRASTAMGAKLFNQEAAQMGEIENLLVHPGSGKVAYAVAEIGKYVGMGDKLTVVPWNLIRQSKGDSPGFVVNADKAKLQGATYFDRNTWPDYNLVTWHPTVYGYYKVPPYWAGPIFY